MTAIFFVYLYVPLIILVVFSFNDTRSATVWSGITLDWYVKAFGNDDIQRAALNSLIVATTAMVASTMLATAAALSLTRGRIPAAAPATGLLMLPLMVPEIVTAVATLSLFSALGLRLGLGNIIIAHTVFCIPFAYLPIRARLAGMDPSLEAAARGLHAGPVAAFRLITLPLMAPGILAGAMLAFIVSIDDFVITLMVADAGSTTLPLYIYGLVRRGITPEVNAVSTLLLAVSITLVVMAWLIQRRRT